MGKFKKIYDIIPPEVLFQRRINVFIKKKLLVVFCLILILTINWLTCPLVVKTTARFNDFEKTDDNLYMAANLNFSLFSTEDFSPEILPDQNVLRMIDMENVGSLNFKYKVRVENLSGALCDYLILKDDLTDNFQPLSDFVSEEYFFSENSIWVFTAELLGDDESLKNQICNFDLVFSGWQGELSGLGEGFTDQETIPAEIKSGEWNTGFGELIINEVYYDVLENQHCKESKNEWVELYNPTDEVVYLKDWQICHGYNEEAVCNNINPNIAVAAHGFAVVGHDNSSWIHCFDVPSESKVVNQLGGPWPELNNDGDYIILKNPVNEIKDCVNWGSDDVTCSFSDGVVLGVSEGSSIGRNPSGEDTDTAADWAELYVPSPGIH